MVDGFTTTRTSLHMLAEHVLAPARHAAIGRIGLRAVPGGIGAPPFDSGDGEREVSVVVGDSGVELVVHDGAHRGTGGRSVAITTLRAAGEFLGREPGALS